MIIRMDDVSANTDSTKLDDLCSTIMNFIPDAHIWLGVTFFCKFDPKGAVYPQLPLKGKPLDFFFDVDRTAHGRELWHKVVSHGLWHLDHAKISSDLQEASILTSCNLLRADTFVPPFNSYNEETEQICRRHGIRLIRSEIEGFKSFEWNQFDKMHERWYLHPWRWDSGSMREYLSKELAVK